MLTNKLSKRLESLHKELCRELKIHPARLRFDDTIDSLGRYNLREQSIRINLPAIAEDKYSVEEILAHETYHHYQHIRGWLSTDQWRGQLKSFIKYQRDYREWPWEIGARRYAAKQRRLRGWK